VGILVVVVVIVSALLFYKIRGKKYRTKWDVCEIDSGRVMDLLSANRGDENIVPGGRVRSIHPGGDMELVIRSVDDVL
jgi:hypothetical protein